MCASAVAETVLRGGLGRAGLPSELRRAWCARRASCAQNGGSDEPRPLRVTVIEGQGTGPAVCAAVRKIFKAAAVPVEWDYQTLSVHRDRKTNRMTVNPELLSSAVETGLVLRAQDSSAGQNESLSSASLALNKALNAFVGVRKFVSAVGYQPYGPVNMVNIRDNVSGEYSEIEHVVAPGVVQSIKTVSRKSSLAVAEMAFEYAIKHGHFRITALHKTNVMRLSDGVFVKACREVSACYPDVEYTEQKLDTFCLHATTNPGRYDVLLTTSLYGAFVSAVCGTMSGGLATVPAAAYGPAAAVFSTVSDYGYSSYCRSGDDDCVVVRMPHDVEPIVNPTGLIRAAAWMLDHAGMVVAGRRVAGALETAIRRGVRTRDMGGDASCAQFTDAVIDNLQECPIPSVGGGGGGGGGEECCNTLS